MIYRATPTRLAQPCTSLHDFFGAMFLLFFEYRFGLLLDRFWSQLASQLGPKIHQKSAQEGSKFQANLHHVFDILFNRFWKLEGSGPHVECQVNQKLDHMVSSWPVGRNMKNYKKA